MAPDLRKRCGHVETRTPDLYRVKVQKSLHPVQTRRSDGVPLQAWDAGNGGYPTFVPRQNFFV